jgi:hypothetical protein
MPGRSEQTDAVAAALAASRPSKGVAFSAGVAARSKAGWYELVRDIVAMANSGGGVIIAGVDGSGDPTGADPVDLVRRGEARLASMLADHVGEHYADFAVSRARKKGRGIAVIEVAARRGSPLVFEKRGAYLDSNDKEVTAFERGTVYFRHGRRSEPARSRDLSRFARTEILRLRRHLIESVRRIASAPTGSNIIVVPPEDDSTGVHERFRVVDDPTAPALTRTDFDITHPFRQKEVATVLNERAGQHIAGPYELQCVRRVHGIDSRPEFFHLPKFGSPQYSDAFVSWLLAEWQRDPHFFEKAREAGRPKGSH